MEPTGIDKILVEKYGYEWVNGKAWAPGTAPEPVSQPEPEPASTPISEPNSDPTDMAKMFANFAFDQDDLDLNRIFQSNDTAVFYDDEYVTYGGETYQDVFAVGGNIFAGKNLIVSPSNAVTGGIVEGYLELLWNGTENVEYFGILNSEVPALDIYLAATTRDTTDDYEILNELLSGDDLITLSPENDTARGLNGNDEMFGYSGADKLYGGNGNDNLDGGFGNDILNGDQGDDFINGSFDDDIIYGGPGNDTLKGGAGRDTFVFNEFSGHDTIVDFSDDDDKIVFEEFTDSEVDGFPISANEEGFKVIQFDNDTTITLEGVLLKETIDERFLNYPEPTGINKILVENFGYEWVNGKAWKPGTAPEPEISEQPEPTPKPEQPAQEPSPDNSNWETKYYQLLTQYQNLESENAELKIDATPFSQSDVDAAVAASVAAISTKLSEREAELAAAKAELVEIKNNTQVAQTYDFDGLFYDDFNNLKWTVDGGTKTITWSTVDTSLKFGDQYFWTNANASNYLEEIRQAINLWDEQVESISFEETDAGNAADLAIGITYIDGPGGTLGKWNYYYYDGIITDAAIRIDTDMVSDPKFSAVLLHEIGNILGLGDINRTELVQSVQEEPLNVFSSDELYPDDIAMIKQLYGEQYMLTDDETPFSQSDVDAAVAASVASLSAQLTERENDLEAAKAALATAQANLTLKIAQYDALEEYVLTVSPDIA